MSDATTLATAKVTIAEQPMSMPVQSGFGVGLALASMVGAVLVAWRLHPS